jgi:glycogen debranching enzyme
MRISYFLNGQEYEFNSLNREENKKLNGVLSNPKGDFFTIPAYENVSKFQGFNICDPKTFKLFKIIESIKPKGFNVEKISTDGINVKRFFKSQIVSSMRIPVMDNHTHTDQTFGERGDLEYDEEGVLSENVPDHHKQVPEEKIYLGPTGGFIYEIDNFDGSVDIDLDMREFHDFDKWGRNYETYVKGGVFFVKYSKGEDYNLYLGIKAVNFSYDLIKEWIKKEYSYSKQRGSLWEWYIYRLMEFHVDGNKKLIFGAGFSESEVVEQIVLLEEHQKELEKFDEDFIKAVTKDVDFEKPISQDTQLAYNLSNLAMYKFLNQNFEGGGVYAGFPWFIQVWSRDDLICLRSLINRGEMQIVKRRIMYYLQNMDESVGKLKRLMTQKDSEVSVDAMFLLAKRVEDLIFFLEEHEFLNLSDILSEGELEFIYEKLNKAFNVFIKEDWDHDEELLKVKYADSWMDTIPVNLPLDIQVGLLEYVSVLAVLAGTLHKKDEVDKFLDFENVFRLKIRNTYFRNGVLYNEPYEDKHNCNVFLAYYLYPDLFFRNEWEQIFDKAVMELQTDWGGMASLSIKHPEFVEEYSGENNRSYHNGDSWFWINNIAAIALNDINEKKYRGTVNGILLSSTKDILKMGSIGFASEISSFKVQKSEGCFAQAWSSATYIEMIDKLFEKKY